MVTSALSLRENIIKCSVLNNDNKKDCEFGVNDCNQLPLDPVATLVHNYR